MTQSLKLRALEKDDLSFLHQLFNDSSVMDFWFEESYMTLEYLKESFDKNKNDAETREFMLTNDNGDNIGYVGLFEIHQRHRHAEFGIMIDPTHQGKGYAAEATTLAVQYAFSVLNLHKLYLIVADVNQKARHVYQKIGFQEEGILREHFFVGGKYHDAIMMNIFQKDYQEQSTGTVET